MQAAIPESAPEWIHLTPFGEFPHREAGVIQVIDRPTAERIVAAFNPKPPGVLLDFDHFSYDEGKRSEAAGWLQELQVREDGIWARVKWSNLGRQKVEGGEYRFVSAVFTGRSAAGGKVFPTAIESAGLTNMPNIKGEPLLMNRETLDVGDKVFGAIKRAGGGKAGIDFVKRHKPELWAEFNRKYIGGSEEERNEMVTLANRHKRGELGREEQASYANRLSEQATFLANRYTLPFDEAWAMARRGEGEAVYKNHAAVARKP